VLRAFGTTFAGDIGTFEPVASWLAGGDGEVRVSLTEPRDLDARWSGAADPERVGMRSVDGRRVRFERGREGDLRVDWEDRAAFWLSPDGASLVCVASDPASAAWARFALDTGMGTVALARGAEALHAGAVAGPGGAVAIIAGQGGGKTSLVAELVHRGRELVCDDIAVLTPELAVEPGPPVMNLASDRSFPPAAQDIGTAIAELGAEAWVAVDRVAAGPVALQAVVLLDRRDGAPLGADRIAPSPVALLGHVLDSGPGRERQAQRFERVADVAERIPILHLHAAPDVLPSTLADVLEPALGDTAPA
jgi:hypothetical protein